MTKKELLKTLKDINEKYKGDEEAIHGEMDNALLEYINDPKITEEFDKEDKWYA